MLLLRVRKQQYWPFLPHCVALKGTVGARTESSGKWGRKPWLPDQKPGSSQEEELKGKPVIADVWHLLG